MMTQSVPVRQRPVIGGIAGAVEGISATVGPLLGGVLTDRLSWRWCFYINTPLGLVTLILIGIFFQNPKTTSFASLSWKEKASRLDLMGTAVFVPSISSLLLALQWGGSKYGWGDVRIIVLLCVSMVLLAAFGFQQWRKGDAATLPARVFGNRSLISGFWFSFCNNAALSVIDYYVRSRPSLIISLSSFPANSSCFEFSVDDCPAADLFSSCEILIRNQIWRPLPTLRSWTLDRGRSWWIGHLGLRLLRTVHDRDLYIDSHRGRSINNPHTEDLPCALDIVPGASWFGRRYRLPRTPNSRLHNLLVIGCTTGDRCYYICAEFRSGVDGAGRAEHL